MLGPHLKVKDKDGHAVFPGIQHDKMNLGWLIPKELMPKFEPVLYRALCRMIRYHNAPTLKDYQDRITKFRVARTQFRQFTTNVRGATHVLVAEFKKKTNVSIEELVEYHISQNEKIVQLARQHLGNQLQIRAMPIAMLQRYKKQMGIYNDSFREDTKKMTPEEYTQLFVTRDQCAIAIDNITDTVFGTKAQ